MCAPAKAKCDSDTQNIKLRNKLKSCINAEILQALRLLGRATQHALQVFTEIVFLMLAEKWFVIC